MKTPICPTCGCSLVRLEIKKEKAVAYVYETIEYLFCCQGCMQEFISEPARYVREISDLIVCPVCLGEKPLKSALRFDFAGEEFHFCRCPHCVEEFRKNLEPFIERLSR
jgi:YHS domain-containing protein